MAPKAKSARAPINLWKLKKDELIWAAKNRCAHRHTYLEHPDCMPPKKERVGYFDIECNGLVADFGIMLSWCLKLEDGEILWDMLKASDIRNAKLGEEDRRLVESAIAAVASCDRIITHYGDDFRFDMPFLRTRAVAMNIEFPQYGRIKHEDTYPILKKKFRLSRNRQENACRTLLGSTEKNHIDGAIWRSAARGDATSLRYILDHNKRDVRDLERLWKRIRNFTRRNDKSI